MSAPSSSAAEGSESLLVFSDVHLGSDLHEASASSHAARSVSVDRDLVELLAHYRSEQPPGGRWRIVIAGDFIDFIGMTIAPKAAQELDTPLTEEELEHGLGSAVDHARLKLKRVAERHRDVFLALASFVSDGHALTLVHGNHDIEFHWDEVKDDFRNVLADLAGATSAEDKSAFLARVEFNPWFFYRQGVAFIEHGHQYDPFCSTAHVMAPVSPGDPRRVARGFCDTLIRFVVRQTDGMKEHGHENVGLAYYVAFGVRLGFGGVVRLFVRFVRAVVELFRLRSHHVSNAARALRAEHERRVQRLAEVSRIGIGRLRALLSLHEPPVIASVRGILASLMLDRLGAAMLAAVAMLVLVGLALWTTPAVLAGGVAVVLGWYLAHRHLSSQRSVDPAAALVERASRLAKLFPAAYVVMGHTHVPQAVVAGDTTYVNVGSWAEEEADATSTSAYRAARTHLVIHVKDDAPEAHFLTWGPRGPEPRILPPPSSTRSVSLASLPPLEDV